MLIHIQRGKGGRDRYVPLSATLLETLRVYWRWMKPKTWLFPGTIHGLARRQTDHAEGRVGCLSHRRRRAPSLRSGSRRTCLRHSYATHLLEAGADLRTDPAAARSRQTRTHRHLSASVAAAPARGRQPAGHDAGLGAGHGAPLASAAEAVTRPPFEVADIIRQHGTASSRRHRAWLTGAAPARASAPSRTAGPRRWAGISIAVPQCAHRAISFNSCRNRHCPKCLTHAREPVARRA